MFSRVVRLCWLLMMILGGAGGGSPVRAEQVPTDVSQLDGVWVWERRAERAAFRLTSGRVVGTSVLFELKGGVLTCATAFDGQSLRLSQGPGGTWQTEPGADGRRGVMKRVVLDVSTLPRSVGEVAGAWQVLRATGEPMPVMADRDQMTFSGRALARLEIRDGALVLRPDAADGFSAVLFRLDAGTWSGVETPSGAPIQLHRPTRAGG